METQHTKGEWHYIYHSPKDETKDKQIIDVLIYGQSNTRNGTGSLTLAEVKINKIWNYNHAEAEANAKLIAAAPDLLQACIDLRQFIIDNIDKLPDSAEVRLKGLKAIVKATE